MSDNLPAPQRDARGYWLKGSSGNPLGKPKRVAEIETLARERAPEAFARIVSLMKHSDPKIALASAIHILDRAFGRPAQSVQAEVAKWDMGALYLEALKRANGVVDAAPVNCVEAEQPSEPTVLPPDGNDNAADETEPW